MPAAPKSDPDMAVLRASKEPGDMIIHVRGGQGMNRGKVKNGLILTANTSFCIKSGDGIMGLKEANQKEVWKAPIDAGWTPEACGCY